MKLLGGSNVVFSDKVEEQKKASAVRNGTEQTESGCPGLVVNENYNSYSMCESSIQKLSHST